MMWKIVILIVLALLVPFLWNFVSPWVANLVMIILVAYFAHTLIFYLKQNNSKNEKRF